MSGNPWKVALLKVRKSVRGQGDASCTGQADDATHGWVTGHNEAFKAALAEIDDAIAEALEADHAPD